MNKTIVETKGDFMLLNTDFSTIEAHRPSVTIDSHFVQEAIGDGRLRVLAVGLPKEATDAEFLKFYTDSNEDKKLAVASYCAVFGLSPQGDKVDTEIKPVKETAAQKKAREKKEKEDKEAFEKAERERLQGNGGNPPDESGKGTDETEPNLDENQNDENNGAE